MTTDRGPGAVAGGAAQLPGLLEDPSYADAADRVASALRELPSPAEAVVDLDGLVPPARRG